MMVDPELTRQVRRAARERARAERRTNADQARNALAGIVDVGSLSDDDVMALYGTYNATLNETLTPPDARL